MAPVVLCHETLTLAITESFSLQKCLSLALETPVRDLYILYLATWVDGMVWKRGVQLDLKLYCTIQRAQNSGNFPDCSRELKTSCTDVEVLVNVAHGGLCGWLPRRLFVTELRLWDSDLWEN